jgi:hypothetical protein
MDIHTLRKLRRFGCAFTFRLVISSVIISSGLGSHNCAVSKRRALHLKFGNFQASGWKGVKEEEERVRFKTEERKSVASSARDPAPLSTSFNPCNSRACLHFSQFHPAPEFRNRRCLFVRRLKKPGRVCPVVATAFLSDAETNCRKMAPE